MIMQNLLLDILPYTDEKVTIKEYTRIITDTVDTVAGAVQPYSNGVSGGGNHSLPFILGGILAALVGLGFLIFMVRSYRRKGEQELSFSSQRL